MSRGAFTKRQKQAMWDREDGCCIACSKPIGSGEFSFQHRKARGMGGTRRKVTLADGVLACGSATTGCHGRMESYPDWARSRGYRVTQWQDPLLVPVWVHGRGEVLLTDDGMYVGVAPEVSV
jgi:hypothetical protein